MNKRPSGWGLGWVALVLCSAGTALAACPDPLPTITVTSPNGGESWVAGGTQTITWTSTNPSGFVNILLSAGR